MRKHDISTLIISILIPITVGMVSSLLAGMPWGAYESVPKSALTPPSWVFPVVWSILYILMGISSYLIYQTGEPWRESGLACYVIQLVFNFGWSIWFFRFHQYLIAFIWLLVMILFIVCMVVRFFRVKPVAGWLQIPYLLWCLFAAYLNWQIYQMM